MADAHLSKTPDQTFQGYSPEDKDTVSWAISMLEDDDIRQHRSIDLNRIEDGLKVWGFVAGNVFLAFVESGPEEITVVHLSTLGWGSVKGPFP